MAKPGWLIRALAIFAVVLYTVDTCSDSYVGYDLFTRCHYQYAASVLSFVAAPGFFIGAIVTGKKLYDHPFCCSWLASITIVLLGGIVGTILFIPGTIVYLVYSAIKTSDDTQMISKG